MELTNDIKEILEDIVFWETCPEEYKDKITEYLTSEDKTQVLSMHDVSDCTYETLKDTVDLIEHVERFMSVTKVKDKGVGGRILYKRVISKLNYLNTLFYR